PETTTGGKALKFYASVRMDIRRIETLKSGTDSVGNRTRVKIVKNKMAPPFKQAEFDILYGEGISREGGLLDLGVEHGVVRKSGAWFTYEGDQLGQGKENSRQFLKDNPDLAAEIEEKILRTLGVGKYAAEPEAPEAAEAAQAPAPLGEDEFLDEDVSVTICAVSPSSSVGAGDPAVIGAADDHGTAPGRAAPGEIRERLADRTRQILELPRPAPDPERAEREKAVVHECRYLMRLLASRRRSAGEMRERLRQREVPGAIAHEVMARIDRAGLIDDESFARDWVQQRRDLRALGDEALRRELEAKQVDDHWIEEALGSGDADEE